MRTISRVMAVLAATAGLFTAAAPAAFAQGGPPPGVPETHHIRSDQGNCLDLGPDTGPGEPGAVVGTWECENSPRQEWGIQPLGDGVVAIVHAATQLCLTATAPNGPAVLEECGANPTQAWRVEDGRLQVALGGFFLTDNGPGNPVTVMSGEGSRWSVMPS